MEGFCTLCNHEVESFEGLTDCPNCSCTNPPCSYANQQTISINLHELRILCIWAENYGLEIKEPDVVYAIVNRLLKQLPPDTTLTMHAEFQQLEKHFGKSVITNHPAADDPNLNIDYKPDLGENNAD